MMRKPDRSATKVLIVDDHLADEFRKTTVVNMNVALELASCVLQAVVFPPSSYPLSNYYYLPPLLIPPWISSALCISVSPW
jgi:hypothetical protein